MDASVSLAEVPNCQSSYVRGGLFPSSHDGEKCQMEPASMALPFPSLPPGSFAPCLGFSLLPASPCRHGNDVPPGIIQDNHLK